MPRTTFLAGLAGGALLVGAGGLLAGAVFGDDPVGSVDAVSLDAVDADSTQGSQAGEDRRVIALEELTGTFERRGDDVDDFGVGRVDVELGPDSWLLTAGPSEDFDGDGGVEALRDELDGMVGSEVRLLVRYDDDRDDADIYAIGDLPYRDTTGGPAPWESDEQGSATRDDLVAAAVAAVGEGSRVTDLEGEDDGARGWEVEVTDASGQEHRVLLDPDANVLDVRLDD